jgi:hypothetical protein
MAGKYPLPRATKEFYLIREFRKLTRIKIICEIRVISGQRKHVDHLTGVFVFQSNSPA